MYKVFYNNRIVFFIDNNQFFNNTANCLAHIYKNKQELVSTLKLFKEDSTIKTLYILCTDVNLVFNVYKSIHTIIEAAGGLVRNNNKQWLFIFRRNKWDLPKGKLENKELPEDGGIREVEEECGILNIKIDNHLIDTYHTYFLNGEEILKRTYWYAMNYFGNDTPTPQTEEEITEAVWLGSNDLNKVVQNTFPSIIEVMEEAKIM